MYQLLFKLLFRHFDPELMHKLGVLVLRIFGLLLRPVRFNPVSVMGLDFENQLGVAAGFDKNAKLVKSLHRLGFGHVEIGTVTPLPQAGNPKPRMFRIYSKRAIINRMGFNNDGAAVIAERLRRLRRSGNLPVIGVNIGKNKDTAANLATRDYQICTEILAPVADYLVVNVSSPNTPGLRDLQQISALEPILSTVLAHSLGKPVLVKIAPDLIDEDVESVAQLIEKLGLAGVIAANTTLDRSAVAGLAGANQAGGLSGPMLANRALEMLQILREHLAPERVVVSVGGVTTQSDFDQRIALGANLVQAYTGFIYGGPLWCRKLLVRR